MQGRLRRAKEALRTRLRGAFAEEDRDPRPALRAAFAVGAIPDSLTAGVRQALARMGQLQNLLTKIGEVASFISPEIQAIPTFAPIGGQPGSGPTHLAGLNPSAYVLPDGKIRTPSLVGLRLNRSQRPSAMSVSLVA